EAGCLDVDGEASAGPKSRDQLRQLLGLDDVVVPVARNLWIDRHDGYEWPRDRFELSCALLKHGKLAGLGRIDAPWRQLVRRDAELQLPEESVQLIRIVGRGPRLCEVERDRSVGDDRDE